MKSDAKAISVLKWFSLIWIVANFALLELSVFWVKHGWPPMLSGLWPFKPSDFLFSALLMAPGVIALIALWVLLIRKKLRAD